MNGFRGLVRHLIAYQEQLGELVVAAAEGALVFGHVGKLGQQGRLFLQGLAEGGLGFRRCGVWPDIR